MWCKEKYDWWNWKWQNVKQSLIGCNGIFSNLWLATPANHWLLGKGLKLTVIEQIPIHKMKSLGISFWLVKKNTIFWNNVVTTISGWQSTKTVFKTYLKNDTHMQFLLCYILVFTFYFIYIFFHVKSTFDLFWRNRILRNFDNYNHH